MVENVIVGRNKGMDEELMAQLQTAVAEWAKQSYGTDDVVAGLAAIDEEENRYLVDFAVRPVGYWQVAEVWLDGTRVQAINDLGEGIPLSQVPWPWFDGK
jgi:hypothetical protein